jgi:mRNA interferase RelE/StbE
VRLKKTAQRDIKSLDRPVQKRILARLTELASEPRPAGAELLTGLADVWRVRVGDYRIVYTIKDDVLLVLVLRVGHRREIYKLTLPSLTLTAEEDEDGEPGKG